MNLKNSQSKKNLDKKLLQNLNGFRLPKFKQFKYILKVLNPKERKIFLGAAILLAASIITLGLNFYFTNFQVIPKVGGEYIEGLVGAPQYINPILSQTNDVDSDISHLIFSGLMRYDNELQLVGDLAESWTLSDDQKEYTFVLKNNLVWQDGEPLTVDDVIFTVKSIQDPDFKSPLLVSFRGIQVIKKDPRTLTFKLPETYPAFLEVMTFGILPEHIWQKITSSNANLSPYNLKPIGSGAWQFKSFTKDELGNIRSYVLEPNANYYGLKPYLQKITFKFYPDFQTAVVALQNHSVDGISFLPKDEKKEIASRQNIRLYSFGLPQYTAIFFNQKANEYLTDKTVRQALQAAIDKTKILTNALQLEGTIIDSPILPTLTTSNPEGTSYNPGKALDLLLDDDWEKITPDQYKQFLKDQAQTETTTTEEEIGLESTSTTTATSTDNQIEPEISQTQKFYLKKDNKILEVTLTTVNQPENFIAASLIKEAWENIGVKVELQIVEPGKITRDIIKPRNYQALLFGIIVGSNPDPYPFWHSSQAADPRLNLAGFVNRQADKLLEDARTTTDESVRQKNYQAFQDLLASDIPAIFLYNPTYTYAVDKKIKGINISRIIVPADRFNNLSEWYINTKRIYHPAN